MKGIRHRPLTPFFVGLIGLALLAACGGDASTSTTSSAGTGPDATTATTEADITTTAAAVATTGGDGGTVAVDPCDLATPEMVSSAFGGTASAGEPGPLPVICIYTVDGGSTSSVSVYYYGDSSDWDGIRSGFDSNRGGTTDVSGIGEAAFHPNDAGPAELIVRAGDVVFSVSAGFDGSDEVNADVAELATAIAAAVG